MLWCSREEGRESEEDDDDALIIIIAILHDVFLFTVVLFIYRINFINDNTLTRYYYLLLY